MILRRHAREPIGYGRRIVALSKSSLVRLPVVALACLLVLSSCSSDDGESVVNLTASEVGTCLDFGDSIEAEITELPVVPCGEPHSHEIYAIEFSEAATYPGLEALEADAQAKCLGVFEDYVGVSAFDSELFFSWLVPTLNSWDREDDRQIVCVIGEGNGAPLVGTVKGIAR
jgi:hypothetical protein